MNPTSPTQPAVLGTCSRALQLAADLSAMAIRLRATAAELLEATPAMPPAIAIAAPPPPARAAAVARGGRRRREPIVEGVLAAGAAKTTRCVPVITTARHMDLDEANRELRAVARYGAWQPSPAAKPLAPARGRR